MEGPVNMQEESALKSPGRPINKAERERRKREILAVAARYFAAQGYSGTDLNDLATAASVSKPTLYYYFKSKEGLFLAALDSEVRRLRDSVVGQERSEGPLEELCRAIWAYLAFFDANPHVVELLIEERSTFKARETSTYFVHRDETLPYWRGLLQVLVESGRVRPIDPEVWIDVASNSLYGTVFTNHFSQGKKCFEEQASEFLSVLLSGLLLTADPPSRYTSPKRT
jgi:AcrR family transcriptional regulator